MQSLKGNTSIIIICKYVGKLNIIERENCSMVPGIKQGCKWIIILYFSKITKSEVFFAMYKINKVYGCNNFYGYWKWQTYFHVIKKRVTSNKENRRTNKTWIEKLFLYSVSIVMIIIITNWQNLR